MSPPGGAEVERHLLKLGAREEFVNENMAALHNNGFRVTPRSI